MLVTWTSVATLLSASSFYSSNSICTKSQWAKWMCRQSLRGGRVGLQCTLPHSQQPLDTFPSHCDSLSMVNPFSCSGDCSPLAPSHVLLVINIQIYSMVSASSLFPLLSIKATKEPKATLLTRQQAEAGKEHEMQKNTHTCMYMHTHRKFYVTFYLRI